MSLTVGLLTHEAAPHLELYLTALAEAPQVATVWLSDPSGKVQPAARRALGAKLAGVFTGPRPLLDKATPGLALVTMEAVRSPEAVAMALDAGCHVMAEKPACVRIGDFERLASRARDRGKLLMLALANRIDPVILEAKRVLDAGSIGKLYGCELHLVADQTRLTRPSYHQTWTAQKARSGGGHLIWLGIHWLDLAVYLTGAAIEEVSAFTANVGKQPLDVEDSAAVAFRMSNGALGTLTSAYYVDKGYHSYLKFWGAEGWLEVRLHGGGHVPLVWYTKRDGGKRTEVAAPREPSGYSPFVQRVALAALGTQAPPLDTLASLNALRVVFAGYKAAESGMRQAVRSSF